MVSYGDDRLDYLMYESIKPCNHNFVVDIFIHLFGSIIYPVKNKWYVFMKEHHKWCRLDYIDYLIENVYRLYIKMCDYHTCHKNYENNNKILKLIDKIMCSLGNQNVRERIIRLVKKTIKNIIPSVDSFMTNMNINPYLIGFDNGVYDMHTHTFRNGQSDDYITMTTGYDYIGTHTHEYINLLNFLEQILPDKNTREYMLDYMGYSLVGTNKINSVHLLYGHTKSGKSKFRDLIKYTLGDYFGEEDVDIFCERINDHAIKQSYRIPLLSLRHKRIVFTEKSGMENMDISHIIKSSVTKCVMENDVINTGLLVNDGGMVGRVLGYSVDYITKNSFTPHFSLSIICDKMPTLDNEIITRTLCIKFPSKKLIDTSLGEKILKWKNDMFLLLVEHYKKVCLNGLHVPESVLLHM